jgi:3-hydroxybutyrate dehydrogenase
MRKPTTQRAGRSPRSRTAPVTSLGQDLGDPAQVQRMMQEVLEAGPLDILVNNAGIQHTASLADMPRARWDAILAINLSAAFDTMRLALPGMMARGYGRIVNIASVHGLVASVQKAPYVAAKFGLVGLTRVAALEAAQAGNRASGGVTANCICPGWTETAIIEPQIQARAAEFGGDREAGIRDLLREKQPSGRTSTPDEIARMVLWPVRPGGAQPHRRRHSRRRRLDGPVIEPVVTSAAGRTSSRPPPGRARAD